MENSIKMMYGAISAILLDAAAQFCHDQLKEDQLCAKKKN
jgi:hypothetical protein